MFTNPNEVAKPSIFLPSGGFKPADRRAASRFSLRLGRQKMCPVSCRCRCTWPQVTPRKQCRAVPGRSLWSLVTYGLWRLNQIQISQIREKMGKTKSECCESIMKVLRHKLPVPSSPGASMLIRAYRGSARFTASSLRCRCSASLPLQYWHSIDTVLTQLTQYCYHLGSPSKYFQVTERAWSSSCRFEVAAGWRTFLLFSSCSCTWIFTADSVDAFPAAGEEPQLELQLLQATSDLLLKEIDT